MRGRTVWLLCGLAGALLLVSGAGSGTRAASAQSAPVVVGGNGAVGAGSAAAAGKPIAGPVAGDTLESLRRLVKQGRYAEAETAARALLAAVEETSGRESLEAADVLDILVEALWRGGKAREAQSRELAERAIQIKEKTLGKDHPAVASSLNNLAALLIATGDYAGARPLHERALAIREKSLGPDHPEVASSLNGLAKLLWNTGDYAGARPLLERALAIREKALGPDHPDVAQSLNGLAALLWNKGDYAGARPLFERALAIREKVQGPNHPDVASSVNNLATLLTDMGDYAGTRPLYERALAIREKALGPDHPDVAFSLNNLANLLRDTGDYAGARPLLERALAIREKALGPDHPDVAWSLNNLAVLLWNTGDYAGARPLYERALAIGEKAQGPDHPDVASSLNNLAALLRDTGDYAAARPLLERALAIREKALGPDHPDVAWSLDNLANLLWNTGDHAGARLLLERALAIGEKAQGPDHPDVASSLNNLANLLRDTGDYAAAHPLFERALAIREKALGPDHADVASSLNDLAQLQLATGERPLALENALRSESIGRDHLRLTIGSLPERQALRYAEIRASGLGVALSSLDSLSPAGARSKALDALVRSRALVLDEVGARRHALRGSGDPELAALAERLRSASARYANLLVRGPDSEHSERYRGQLEAARREKEQAEGALAERSASFRSRERQRQIDLAEVASALPPGSALVSYARYPRYASDAKGAAGGAIPSYLAFVLRSGVADPVLVPLGRAAEIDSLVSRWAEEAGWGARRRGLRQAEGPCAVAGEALRKRVWDPVGAPLRGEARVFIVPDGALHLVNMAALPAGAGRYLVEGGPLLHTLSAERDLVPSDTLGARPAGLLAVGGADFDARPSALVAVAARGRSRAQTALASGGASGAYRGERSGCGDFRSLRFPALPASAAEAREVTRVWVSSKGSAAGDSDNIPVGLQLTGMEASEAEFKALAPGRRVLHIATHGFFLGGRCPSALESVRDIGASTSAAGAASGAVASGPAARPGSSNGAPRLATGENPLLLSGLALAGANRRDQAGPDQEDGILTAEEIAALDLSGCEWAVLSACETGLGEVRAGEGVFGLRRAFQVAGAGTVIMSLWSVEDEAARRWMRALYAGRLVRGLSTAAAVREASLAVLRERRARGQSTHPFYWGAFVAAGDWR